MMCFSRLIVLLILAIGLSGCGGSEGVDAVSPERLPPLAQAALDPAACDPQSIIEGTAQALGGRCVRATAALRGAARPHAMAVAATQFTPDMLMNWAETQYPTLFAPVGQRTQISLPYTFRYYPATRTYLGVAGSDVYVLGPVTGNLIARVGSMSDFSCVSAQIGCVVPAAPAIIGIKPYDSSAIIEFNLPADSGSGPVVSYGATCASGLASFGSATGSGSPITVSGLANGKSYSCVVTAINQYGTSAPSTSKSVTPGMASYAQTKIKLVSDSGDFIGLGKTYEYTKANAQVSVSANGGVLSVGVTGDEWWLAQFALPTGSTVWSPGTYSGLTRYPFHDASKGGLDWSGEGRGCNTLKASMTVRSASYSDGQLDSISMSFTQYCEGGSSALRGDITWGANDPTTLAGPQVPVPSNLWKAGAGVVPNRGNYVYLVSDPGDWVGQGLSYLFTDGQVSASASGGGALVSVSSGSDYFTGNFVSMSTLPLQVGYYRGLSRYPFHNPAKGGLDWSGSGRGCNKLAGWFAVDELAYENNSLRHIKLRFEQHCEEGTSAMRGQIDWTAP